jgi:TetR/AcrR family transcriptional repressor of nem operon
MVRPREFEEALVVEQAMMVFWRKGYQGTSVQDLVEATGLQRGSLYGAFGDKHGLFLAALDAYVEFTLARFDAMLAEADTPLDAVRAFVQQGGADCAHPITGAHGCMVGNTASELAAHDADARELVALGAGRLQQRIADTLRAAQADGRLAPDRDPEAVAAFIQCGLQGLTLLAKTRPGDQVIRGVVGEILATLD